MDAIVFLICAFPFSIPCQYCRFVRIWYPEFQFHIALYKFQRSLCHLIFMAPIDIYLTDRNSFLNSCESYYCILLKFLRLWNYCWDLFSRSSHKWAYTLKALQTPVSLLIFLSIYWFSINFYLWQVFLLHIFIDLLN